MIKDLLLGIGIAVLFMLYYYVIVKKTKKNMAEIDLTQYTAVSFVKEVVPLIVILLVATIAAGIVGFLTEDHVLITTGISMTIIALAEAWLASKQMVFYYNDTRCIIANKQVPYKNIKYCMAKSRLPLAKGVVEMYNGERKNVYHGAIEIITSHMENRK